MSESVRNGDANWEGDLVAAHHVLSVTEVCRPDGTATPQWMDAHNRFHATLAAACPNSTIQVIRQQLFDEAELYRHRSGPGAGPPPGVAEEHRALLDAALRRDADGTADLLIAHIQATAERAVDAFSATPVESSQID